MVGLKIIIAGSRGIEDMELLRIAIMLSGFSISEVVSGGARGVDTLGELWANENGVAIKRLIPDWGRFGRAAGMYRNGDMADYADGGIILWDGNSRGTLDMIDKLRRAEKPVEVWGDDYMFLTAVHPKP